MADRRHRAIALVVGAVALVLVVLGVAVAFSFLDQMSQPPVAQSVADVGDGAATGSVVVVQAGDTLTSIARDLQPDGDIGPLVERLAAIHGPGPLLAGDRLDVPMSVTGTG